MDPALLETTVVNTSGERKYFDFLPVAGMYLEDGQELTLPGSLTEWIRRKGCGPVREKMITSLTYALSQGWLEVKCGPAPILFDVTLDKSSAIGIDNAAVTITDI